MTVGVLAVQGAFIEHEKMLRGLGAQVVELRKRADLDLPEDINPATGVGKRYDAIVLPGGESTVQGKLLKELDMFDTLKLQISAGIPVLATCAGMILLAERICNDDRSYFQTMPVIVRRNAYGRQLGSFSVEAELKGVGKYPFRFIRAPYVERVSEGVDILAKVEDRVVAVRYQNQLALAFHPELTEDDRVHRMFLESLDNY